MGDLAKVEESCDVKFNDQKLLNQVFIHRSYLNESHEPGLEHNERLEFLGDAVMELVVTEHLYKEYQEPEGVLTNWRAALVKGEMISTVSATLGFEDQLKLSRGEQQSSGKARSIILANTFEAFIGALYLDQGYDPAKEFIHKNLIVHLGDILENNLHIDPKSQLQELLQTSDGITPSYNVISEVGPDHNKVFTVAVLKGKTKIAEGQGQSKQQAQMSAAREALKVISIQRSAR